MAAATTSTEAEFLAEYWNKKFLKELRANLVLYPLGMMGQHPKGAGLMVHWLTLADFSAASTSSTEGTDPTEHALSGGDQTATVQQYNDSILISDLLQDTYLQGTYDQLLERIGRLAGLRLDTAILGKNLTAGGAVQYAGTAVARNSIAQVAAFYLDTDEVREAVRTMESANVPRYDDGFYRGIVHPMVKYDLIGSTAWRDTQVYTKNVDKILKNEIGEIYGARFVETTQALSSLSGSEGTTSVYQTYIQGKEHFGISELYKPQVIVKNPHPASDLDLYGTIGYKAALATKELNSSQMIRIESAATP